MELRINIIGSIELAQKVEKIGPALTTRALASTVVEVERYIEGQAAIHHKTGALVDSIYKLKLENGGWLVGHDLRRAPHSEFVVWGTKPHVIRAKNKLFLRWAGGGKFHFAKKVNHPGTKPDNYINRAAALTPVIFARHVDLLLKNIL